MFKQGIAVKLIWINEYSILILVKIVSDWFEQFLVSPHSEITIFDDMQSGSQPQFGQFNSDSRNSKRSEKPLDSTI
jgi:hypothetical protein